MSQQWEGVSQYIQGQIARQTTDEAWRSETRQSIASLSQDLARMRTGDKEHFAVTRRMFHDNEYYRYEEYRRSQQADPMDIDRPRQPPAPLHYRGEPSSHPPLTEYQHYQPLLQSQYTGIFDGMAESIFGYGPPYPGFPHQPPPQ